MNAQYFELQVFEPTGHIEVKYNHAQRRSHFHNTVVAELSDSMWESHRTFPEIRKHILKSYPDLHIVPYSQMPNIYQTKMDQVLQAVKDSNCQAAIIGNAA